MQADIGVSVNGPHHPHTSFCHILPLSVTCSLKFKLQPRKPWSKVLLSGSKGMFSCFNHQTQLQKYPLFSQQPKENDVWEGS